MKELDCETRYPILLVHGTGFRDVKGISYWGRIPKALEAYGAAVFFGGQDSWATVEKNADALKHRVSEILEQTGCEEVNIIAHSKGGLEARYLASSLGMGQSIASITMISTPNRGSKTMDVLARLPKVLFRMAGLFVNGWCRLIGDKHPDFCAACFQFTTKWAQAFNESNPDAEGVVYRSYAGAMRSWRSDLWMGWPNIVIGLFEGENDGMVTPESARWTGFQEVWRGVGGRGVSHMDEVDFRRRPLKRGGAVFDIVDCYVKMVCELKTQGL